MIRKPIRTLSFLLVLLMITAIFASCTVVLPSANGSPTGALTTAGNEPSPTVGGTTSSATADPTANPGGSGKITIPGDFNDSSVLNINKYNLVKMLKIDPKKLFDIGKILGGSGNTGSTKPSLFALTTKDIGMPVLNDLGFGYDVFDNYASAKYVKEGQILDLEKLIKDGKVFRKDMSESSYKEVTATSARSYATSVATSVKLSGNYLYFSGSVKYNFSSSHLEQANHYFSTIFYDVSLYSLYIDPATDLSKYIKPEFINILNTKDARWIFENYGTHLVRSLQAGGRFDYNTSVDKQYIKDEKTFSASVKASFNAVFASASASVETTSTTTTEEFKQNSETRIFTYGGDGVDGQSMQADPQTLKKWMESVKTNPSISDFGDNALVPIWDFCTDASRKQYLQEEFDQYAQEKLSMIPSTFVINGLRLNVMNVSDPVVNEFTDESGEWHLVSNIAAHTMLPGDKLVYLYCRYGRADDTDNAPVVEIILENAKEQENVRAYFDEKYKDDPTARLYGWNGTHSIEGSNLGVSINQEMAIKAGAPEMYLFYVTSSKKPPVKSVIVRYVNQRGETSYIPSPPESNLQYEQILDQTKKKNGQIMAQDTGEGVGDYYKQGMFEYLICKNHYIEYALA